MFSICDRTRMDTGGENKKKKKKIRRILNTRSDLKTISYVLMSFVLGCELSKGLMVKMFFLTLLILYTCLSFFSLKNLKQLY